MSEYGKKVAKKTSDYIGNIDSVDEEVRDIQHAVEGVNVRGALAAGVRKSFDISKGAEGKADEAHDVMESIMDEGFDNAALESNFEQKLDDKIDNLQPEWTEFQEDTKTQLADTNEYFSKNGLTNRRTPRPMFIWVDDDGKKELYTILYPIFKKRGIPLTAAIIPSRVGTSGYVTESETKEMMSKGLEILSHTDEHDPNDRPIDLPKERLREGYRSAKQKIVEWGGNPHGVVYPFGNYNETIDEVAREFHDYAFNIGTLEGIVEPPINSYSITRYNPMNKSIEDSKEKLDEVYEKNALIVMISHVGESTFDKEKSIELIDYAISKGFEFVTTEKGIGYHGNLLELDADNTIDSKGTIRSNKLGKTRITKDNEFLASNLPSDFDAGITMTKIDVSEPNNTDGLPLNLYGSLITQKSVDSNSQNNWTHQTFYAGFRNLVAHRHAAASNTWSEWHVNYMPEGNGELPDNSKPRNYPLGTTTTTIEGPNATDTPFNHGGLLTTTKTKDSYLWIKQEFFDVSNNEAYTRRADNLDAWRDWKRVKQFYNKDENEINGNTPISEYETGVTHGYIRGNSSGLPSGKQSGNLVNYKEPGATRSYQTLRVAGSEEMYLRGGSSDGSWRTWKRIVVEDI